MIAVVAMECAVAEAEVVAMVAAVIALQMIPEVFAETAVVPLQILEALQTVELKESAI